MRLTGGFFVFALRRWAADVRPPWLPPHKRRRPFGLAAPRAGVGPSSIAFWRCIGPQGRKRERAPEPLRGKPSSADALRPAPEGAHKKPEDCARGGERLNKQRAKVTGMRFDSAAVPATVSGECGVRSLFSRGQPLGVFGPPGRRASHAAIREPGDRPGRVALCLVQGLARRGN